MSGFGRNFCVFLHSKLTPFIFWGDFEEELIMLQTSEIQKRFRAIEQTIDEASDACRADSSVSADLKQCVQWLDRQSAQARSVIDSSDTTRMAQVVDDLEQIGDQAVRACKASTQVNPEVRNAIVKAHDALSDLKHQLH
jgi:hypothetical protein